MIDGSAVAGINYANVREDRFTLEGYDSGDAGASSRSSSCSRTQRPARQKPVRIIGIMERGPSETYRGVWLSAAGMTEAFEAFNSKYYVRLAPTDRCRRGGYRHGGGPGGVRGFRGVDRRGDRGSAIAEQRFLPADPGIPGDRAGRRARSRWRSSRSAPWSSGGSRSACCGRIGFTRASVALVVRARVGVHRGAGDRERHLAGALLANRMLASDQFSSAGFQTFHVPWLQIGLVALGVFTAAGPDDAPPFAPGRLGIPPAEALRYE